MWATRAGSALLLAPQDEARQQFLNWLTRCGNDTPPAACGQGPTCLGARRDPDPLRQATSLLRSAFLPFRMGGFEIVLVDLRPGTERGHRLQKYPTQRR